MRVNRETLNDLYWGQELTQREIAIRCHISSKDTIRAWMRKFNIPTRGCHEALLLAYQRNPQRKLALAEALRQSPRPPPPVCNKGIPCSKERKEAISRANKGRPSPMKGKTFSVETRERMSLARRGKPSPKRGIPQSEEQRENLSKAHMGQQPWNKGIPMREESKKKLQESNRKYFADLSCEEKEKWLKNVFKGLRKRPTALEKQLISMIEDNKLPYKYVGDGQFILGGKNPDFLNVNGKKQVIEAFGCFWHDVFDVAERIEHFRQYGFDTLIIWEDEMADTDAVISKIKKFSHRKVEI